MRLGDKQRLFSELAARLILKAITSGYQVSLGEAYRPETTAKAYASTCKCGHPLAMYHTRVTDRANRPRGCTNCRCSDFRPLGTANSLHIDRLAIDLNLFKKLPSGRWGYCRSTEDHRFLGEWWEQQHSLCRWGGHFGDGNHYSLAHRGRK